MTPPPTNEEGLPRRLDAPDDPPHAASYRWHNGPEMRRLYRSLILLAVILSGLAVHYYVVT